MDQEINTEQMDKNTVALGIIRMTVGNQKNGPLFKLLQMDLPIRAAWRLKKIKDMILKEFQSSEDSRTELIKKYGEKLENGNYSITDKSKVELFTNEFNQILSEPIKLDMIPIDISMIGDIKLSTSDLELLEACGVIKVE
jgi:5-hydroxyisourate hydrolase-like protein (transthyretin family)